VNTLFELKKTLVEYIGSLPLRSEFLDTLVIGILGAFVLKTASFFYSVIMNRIYTGNHLSISGYWIANFSSYVAGKNNMELVRIRQNKESIELYIEQHSNISSKIKKFKGKGIFRGAEMSAIYFPVDHNKTQNGVFILKLLDSLDHEPNLSGIYSEFVYDNEKRTNIHKGDYSLKPVDLPFQNILLFLFRKSYFSSLSDIDAFLKKQHDATK